MSLEKRSNMSDYDQAVVDTANGEILPTVIVNDDGTLSTPATGVAQPTGGSGWLGWLSGIYATLRSLLSGSETIVDVATSDIVATSTSAVISPTILNGTYSILVDVDAASGTSKTLDIVVQTSEDGENWLDVYHFERITAPGAYRSGPLPCKAAFIRYVETVGGTTPSFTRSFRRVSKSGQAFNYDHQFYNRTLDPTALNSSTPAYNVDGCNEFEVLVKLSAYAATGPTLRLQLSDDGSAWYTAVATTTLTNTTLTRMIPIVPSDGANPKFARVNVSNAGAAGNVLESILLKAYRA